MIACVPTTMSTSPAAICCNSALRCDAWQSAGQLCAADLACGEQFIQRQGVLPGEDFGRGHQHRLISVRHGQEHGIHGHHGFSAADFALQQPVHGQRAGHVAGDFGDCLLLAFGQFEGEQAANPGVDLRRGFQRRRPALVVLLPPLYGQGQLQHEKLLIHESPPRLVQTLPVAGKMNLRQGFLDRPEIMGIRDIRREKPRRAIRRNSPARRGRSCAYATAASLR